MSDNGGSGRRDESAGTRERRHERRSVLRQQPPVRWINVIDGQGGAQQPKVQKHLVRMNQARDMDRLTSELTDKLNPQWGAVRNLFTPAGGTVVKDVNELEPGKAYVVGGNKFRPHPTVQAAARAVNGDPIEEEPAARRKRSKSRERQREQPDRPKRISLIERSNMIAQKAKEDRENNGRGYDSTGNSNNSSASENRRGRSPSRNRNGDLDNRRADATDGKQGRNDNEKPKKWVPPPPRRSRQEVENSAYRKETEKGRKQRSESRARKKTIYNSVFARTNDGTTNIPKQKRGSRSPTPESDAESRRRSRSRSRSPSPSPARARRGSRGTRSASPVSRRSSSPRPSASFNASRRSRRRPSLGDFSRSTADSDDRSMRSRTPSGGSARSRRSNSGRRRSRDEESIYTRRDSRSPTLMTRRDSRDESRSPSLMTRRDSRDSAYSNASDYSAATRRTSGRSADSRVTRDSRFSTANTYRSGRRAGGGRDSRVSRVTEESRSRSYRSDEIMDSDGDSDDGRRSYRGRGSPSRRSSYASYARSTGGGNGAATYTSRHSASEVGGGRSLQRADSKFSYKSNGSGASKRTVEVNYDTDDSGLYRASSAGQDAADARTVGDSSRTKVDTPVDYAIAKEVPEE